MELAIKIFDFIFLHMSPDDQQLHFLGPELCLLLPITEQKQI
jgi:hypothetical protein